MTDVFRKQYRKLSDQEKVFIDATKEKAKQLWDVYDMSDPSREMSLAKTRLEESIFWFTKAIS